MRQSKIPGWKRRPLRRLTDSVGITIRSVETMEPLFDILFYGVTMSQLCSVIVVDGSCSEETLMEEAASIGGGLIRSAIRRRGLDPELFIATPFDAYDLNEERT